MTATDPQPDLAYWITRKIAIAIFWCWIGLNMGVFAISGPSYHPDIEYLIERMQNPRHLVLIPTYFVLTLPGRCAAEMSGPFLGPIWEVNKARGR